MLAAAGSAAAATALLIFLTASPAQAHNTYVYHGADFMSIGYSSSSGHYGASVCDQSNDGRGAIGIIWLNNGTSRTVSDSYGGGCATYYTYTALITHFQLCKVGGSCSARLRA